MGKKISIKNGDKHGRLTVINIAEPVWYKHRILRRWQCLCECGKTVTIRGSALTSGNIKSCGCLHKEIIRTSNITHGRSRTPEYAAWCNIVDRCTNPNNKDYKHYGGRGISICDEWRDFSEFLSYVGSRPSAKHSIDRIDDNGGYEPDNVRWATQKEQNRNKRSNHIIDINGITKTLSEWSEISGNHWGTILWRLRNGWEASKAVFTKPRK